MKLHYLHGLLHSPAPPGWKWSGCTWMAGGCVGPPCPADAESWWPAPCAHSPRWTHTDEPNPSPCSPGFPQWCWWCSQRWRAYTRSHPLGMESDLEHVIHYWRGNGKIWHRLNQITSSLSMLDKKFIMTLCFRGYFWQRALMACTTTTWGQQTHSVQKKKDKEMQY